MNASDVAKWLALIVAILFVIGCGLLVLPLEARSWRAAYCGGAVLVLAAFLFLAKPHAPWVRSALAFVTVSMALMGLAVALGA